MNEIKQSLKFYNSYFYGVHDIIRCKSAKQTALGALKIISGFTLVIPIIFGIGSLISRHKLHKLENLCDRVSKDLTSLDNTKTSSQKELITFLSKKVLDRENNDFETAFKRLNSTSQNTFFASMADIGALPDSLTYTPKDIREITVSFGKHPSMESIDKAIEHLSEFKQLHTITFDLSQTTHYKRDSRPY